jgi:hypothetical protein
LEKSGEKCLKHVLALTRCAICAFLPFFSLYRHPAGDEHSVTTITSAVRGSRTWLGLFIARGRGSYRDCFPGGHINLRELDRTLSGFYVCTFMAMIVFEA